MFVRLGLMPPNKLQDILFKIQPDFFMPTIPNNETDRTTSPEKTEQLIEYVEMLVMQNEEQQESSELVSPALEKRFQQIENLIESQAVQICHTLESRLFDMLKHCSKPAKLDSDPATDSEECWQWDRQKQNILAEYGCSSESEHQGSPVGNPSSESEKLSHPSLETNTADLDSLHDTIDNISCVDAEEIEDLKERLTTKLREAEVELSINRAKLSQKQAALEQQQFEITQRELALESKYGEIVESGKTAKKNGFLDRLSRHISRKPNGDSDEAE